MLRTNPARFLALLSLCAALAGCSFPPGPYNVDRGPTNTFNGTAAPTLPATRRAHTRPAGVFLRREAGLTAAQEASRDRNCGAFGPPRLTDNFGRTDFAGRWGYFLEHSATDKVPLWVCECIEPAQLNLGPVLQDRPKWDADDQLPAGLRAEDKEDYKEPCNAQTGLYDRGHMAPNGDFRTRELADDTFYLSNAVPQIKNNNRGVWKSLESKVRDWVLDRGTSYIITGPMWYDPNSADGSVYVDWIGAAQDIPVPTHVYKIVLAPKKNHPDQWEAIALVFENQAFYSPYPWDAHIQTIDWIEQRTGINFFPSLDDEPTLEHQLEGTKPAHLWTAP